MDGFLGIGFPELIMITVIALIVLGPERLPGTIREVAKFIKQVRSIGGDLMSQFGDEFKDLQDLDPRRILSEMTDPNKPDPDKAKASKPTPPTPAKNTTPATASTANKPTTTVAATTVEKSASTTAPAAAATAAVSTTLVANAATDTSATKTTQSSTTEKSKANEDVGAKVGSNPSIVAKTDVATVNDKKPTAEEKVIENVIAPPRDKSTSPPKAKSAKAEVTQPEAEKSEIAKPKVEKAKAAKTDPAQATAKVTTPDSDVSAIETIEAQPKAKRIRKPKAKADSDLANAGIADASVPEQTPEETLA